MTTSGTYYDGPSVAQGTTGTWFVSGTAVVTQSANVNDIVTCKLWDGTTVIDSDVMIGPVSAGLGLGIKRPPLRRRPRAVLNS